jgi:hypothetical protein
MFGWTRFANKPNFTDDPFPENTKLRKYGFKIHARPRKGKVLWDLEGEIWTHEDAIRFLESLEEC